MSDMVRRWNNAEPNDKFEPETKESYLQKVKEAEDRATDERITAKKKEEAAASVDLKKALKKLAKILKIDLPISRSLDYYRLVTMVARHFASHFNDGLDKAIESFTAESDQMASTLSVKDALHFGYMPSELLHGDPALAGLWSVLLEMYKRYPNYLGFRTANVVYWALRDLEGDKK